MIGSTQGTSTTDINAINQQIQDFKDGKTKITKEDLTNILTKEVQNGQNPSAVLTNIYDSYDKIDKNNDGISYDEFQTYQNTSQGILSTLGISSNSINQQINSLNFEMLGNNSANMSTGFSLFNRQPSLLDTNLFGNASTSSSSQNPLLDSIDTSSSYLNQLMQNYSSTNAVNTEDFSSFINKWG